MDITNTLGGLAKRSLGLFGLADHGKEVSTSQSDRLMLTASGNTTSVTQRAVAPAVMGRSLPEKFRAALDLPASLETIAEKGYVVAIGDWSTNDAEGAIITSLVVPDCFLIKDYAISGLLEYHEYIRCGLEVTLQVNPTEWQMGGLIMWVECAEDGEAIDATNFNNLLTFNSGIVNCNVNNEVTLKQAFTFSRNFYQMHQAGSGQPGCPFLVRIYVWSPLRVATGTSTIVSYKVTASLCDVEMHGIRPQATQIGGERAPAAKAAMKQPVKRDVSSPTVGAPAGVKFKARPAPGYTPSPSIRIEPGVGMLNASNAQELKINAHLTLDCEGFEEDSTFSGGVEATDWLHHLQTPCRFDNFDWSTTSSAGTLLRSYKVHPRQPHNTYTTWTPHVCSTNQSLISSLYRYWRGDLVFLFQVYATKWHSGRFMVCFTPGQDELLNNKTNLKKASTCSAAFYDIHGPQSTFAYRVPYMAPTQYMDCDPTKGFIGRIYIYIYTQMAAPSTVATNVEIITYMAAADNFELFVPSYNAVQMGDEVDNVAEADAGAEDVSGAEQVQRATIANPVGAMEMPEFDTKKVGTFPELKDGTRLHKSSHMLLSNLLGRGHHMATFTYSAAQSFINDYAINWHTMPGYLGAISKCFTVFRGGLKLIFIMETVWRAELYLCFRPSGDEKITTLEQMYKYGAVSLSTNQTNQVVVKLPWYQALAANSIWSEKDGLFGYLTLAGNTTGTVKIHYAIAFDRDSHFYMPRGCPADKFFQPGTKNQAYRYRRSLPDHHHDSEEATVKTINLKPGTHRVLPEEVPSSFVRSSMDRKAGFDRSLSLDNGLDYELQKGKYRDRVVTNFEKAASRLMGKAQKPQMSLDKCYLCRRPSDNYPIDHYFILMPSGRLIGFEQSDSALFGEGTVVEEFHQDYEIVEEADDIAFVVEDMLGRYHRDYNVFTFNCEHWARSHCGLGERSTQSTKITMWLGTFPVGAMAAVKQAAQMDIEMTETRRSAERRFRQWAEQYHGGVVPEHCVQDLEATVRYCFEKRWGDHEFAFAQDLYRYRVKQTEQMEKETKDSPRVGFFDKMIQKTTDTMTNKVATAAAPKVEKAATEAVANLAAKTQETFGEWLKTTLTDLLKSKGAKIAQRVINYILDFCQCMCLIHVCVNYPVPGVLGPLGLAAALGTMRTVATVVARLQANREQGEADLTEEVGSTIYEAVSKVVPKEHRPKAGVKGFLETIRNINLMSSCVKNLMTFGQWLVQAAKKCVDYIFPSDKRKAVDKLVESAEHVTTILASAAAVCPDCEISDGELEFLASKAIEYWSLAMKAGELLKDRSLPNQLLRAFTTYRAEISRRKLVGDSLPRMEPIVVWLHGQKGCGKTMSSIALASMFCRSWGLDPRKDIYSKPVNADYYDGYAQQKIMIMDDVGQTTDGDDFDHFCQLVSAAPLRLNMAHLDEKGRTFTTPIIIASSNIADPNPNNMAHRDALMRRIADWRFLVRVVDKYRAPCAGTGYMSKSGSIPSHVLDVQKARFDGALRDMSCCEFHPGITDVKSPNRLSEIFDGLQRAYKTKVRVHKDIMAMWFDMVEQSGPTDDEQFEMIRKKLDLKEQPPIKIVPVWLRVLAGLGVALAGLLAITAVAGTLYAVASKANSRHQGAYTPGPPTSRAVRVPRVPAMAQSVNDIAKLVKGNLVSIGYRKKETIYYRLQGLFVAGRKLIVPGHFLTVWRPEHELIVLSRDVEYIYAYEDIEIKRLMWAGKEADAVLLTLPAGGVTEYRDIIEHFVRNADVEKVDGSNGVLVTNGDFGVTYVPEEELHFYSETSYGTSVIYNPAGVFIGRGATMDGMCGGGLVSSVNKLGTPILGIHVAGNGSKATTQAITREMLEQQHEQCGKILKVTSCVPVGAVTKTSYSCSPIAGYFRSGKLPAALSPTHADYDIFAVAITKYAGPIKSRPDDWMDFERAFTERMLRTCRLDGLVDRAVSGLSLTEAINGVENLDRVALSTSPGYPWITLGLRKRDLVEWREKEWVATPTLRQAVYQHIQDVEESVTGFGDRFEDPNVQALWNPPITYVTYYKDELRPAEKVASGKTRIIEAAPFHHVLAFRMMFGDAMARLHRLTLDTGFAPGCDIETEAKYLYYTMTKMKVNIDADFKNFDGSLQPFLIYSAMRVLGAIQGVDPITSNCWARLIVRSEHIFGDTKFSVFGGMPSGSPATTVVNTIANLMMGYYVLFHMYPEPLTVLYKQHRLIAYGDDLIISSSDAELGPKMQFWTLKLWEVFGVKMTGARKGEVPKPAHWTDIKFLKRRFERRGPYIYACLDLESIEALLEYQRKDEDFEERVRAALRYAWFHGPGTLAHFSNRLLRACKAVGMVPPDVSTLEIEQSFVKRLIIK